MITFSVNKKQYSLDIDPDMPLLWVLRDVLALTGTKYGCGKGICGSCNVIIDGKDVRSCSISISAVQNKEITTIEGLAADNNNPIIRAWLQEDVVQCGYCQPGQIISATVLLANNPNPTDAEIHRAMSSNLCRCGTYKHIKKAIQRAAEEIRNTSI